ncbi:hypothetical protein [Streptomyces sp. NPDC126514]|uniref:hypothetical protein n=1 Tax=Streptomyces sp. NPDC126514 TaxID=3155210 RepID=UPI00332F79A0
MRTRVSGLGLGPIRGDYALMPPIAGTLLQILRGFLLIAWVLMAGFTVFTPDQVDGNLAWTTAVVIAVYTVTFGWRLLTARLGMNRCYLLAEGVAVTNRFGRVTDSVAWSDVTAAHTSSVGATFQFARASPSRGRRAPQRAAPIPAGCEWMRIDHTYRHPCTCRVRSGVEP